VLLVRAQSAAPSALPPAIALYARVGPCSVNHCVSPSPKSQQVLDVVLLAVERSKSRAWR